MECVQNNAISILQADPGAGKTTRVPPALLNTFPGQVYVLEPRRLAARLAARHVSGELRDAVGQTVGYQVRFEQIGGPETRLWYFTEGVLTRKLLANGQLRNVDVVILDEFHERHLETDLALALLRHLQQRRPKLRLLLMSATLESEHIANKLGSAAIIKAPGRAFPVAVEYTPHSSDSFEQQVASAVAKAAAKTKGHLLVFLPGAAEIRRAMQACEPMARQLNAKLLPLHGDLSPDQQDEAVSPSQTRKIICSTNVAESSVTIDGVEAVIDSGLARVLTHSPWSDLSKLEVQKISQSSAVQRAGRAGRTQAGIAIRLYPESDFVRRPKDIAPEILRSDLAPLLLELSAAGLRFDELPWLDRPAPELIARAEVLLQRIGATKEMAALALPPRLAKFVTEASKRGMRREASHVAALLSEGRIRLNNERKSPATSDLDEIVATDLDFTTRRVRDQLLKSTAAIRAQGNDEYALEVAFLLSYPDRVARRRGETLLLSDGTSARLDANSLTRSEFLVAIEVDARSEHGTPLVRIASHIEPDWLLEYFPGHITTVEELVWNREAERIEQVNLIRYDELAIDESRSPPVDPEAAAALLVDKALETGIEKFAEAEDVARLLRRVQFARQHAPEFAIPEDLVPVALRSLANGLTSFRDLREAARDGGLIAALEANLPMRHINQIAPAHVVLPSGRRARIEYYDGQPPSVSSRLQDFFGMTETPTVAGGAVNLVVKLLAPNQRPVQVTTDLQSFWKNLYPQLRRELGRRYPKHSWPEDPKLVFRDK